MADAVRRLPGGLDAPVEASGMNFSSGERQLLSLARALVPDVEGHGDGGASGGGRNLRQAKVLLCDEATANVDLATDMAVHDALLGLEGVTVVMICHRLQHIGNFDRVVVMRAGEVLEEGAPAALMEDPASELSQLRKRAGLS
jgi:ABC-type multidrug transport system fused ATPase/permease subunit